MSSTAPGQLARAGRRRPQRPRFGTLPNPPPGYTRSGYLRHCYNNMVCPLIREYRLRKGGRFQRRVGDCFDIIRNEYFPYLVKISLANWEPELLERGQVKEALRELSNPRNRLPEDLVEEASRILNVFEQRTENAPPPSQTALPATPENGLPPSDHPIWGDQGIMHGVLMRRNASGRCSYTLDERFPRHDGHVYGHNGLQPGDWFAMQMCACFRGAHDQPQRGIAGDKHRGAYSIVVSGGSYGETDVDEGDVLYYSAQGASKKNASSQADVVGNQALMASWRTRRPVRVLRGHKGSRLWAPPLGYRYDGLYKVVGWKERMNKEGGIYKRFKLVREPGQASLEEIMRASPTAQQLADHRLIKDGY